MTRDVKSRARASVAKSTPDETASRVDHIASVMRAGHWVRGGSAGDLAERWGLSLIRVEGLAAEAWRRVCAEADDAGFARPTIAGHLRVAIEQAAEARDHGNVAKLGDTWSRVVGARAPERHEHAHIVAQFEAMPREGKLAKLLEARAEIDAAIEALSEADDRDGKLLR